jgi:hypothetical protein
LSRFIRGPVVVLSRKKSACGVLVSTPIKYPARKSICDHIATNVPSSFSSSALSGTAKAGGTAKVLARILSIGFGKSDTAALPD